MKKVALLILATMLISTVAFADVVVKETSKKWCHKHKYTDETIPNTDTQRPALEAGLGITLKKKVNSKFLDSINLEVKKDFVDMERGSLYIVLEKTFE